MVGFQFLLDLNQTAPVQVPAVDPPHRLRLLRHDLRLAVLSLAVAQQLLVLEGDIARSHTFLFSPAHILAEGFALRLGKAAKQGDEEFAGLCEGVDVLLLENNADPAPLQHPHGIQRVHGVSGEAGEGFGQDQADLPSLTGGNHLVKLRPLLHAGAREALIREDAGQLPVRVVLDLMGVVLLLGLIAGELLLAVGADPAVGGHPLMALPGASASPCWGTFCGGDNPNPAFHSLFHVHFQSFPGGLLENNRHRVVCRYGDRRDRLPDAVEIHIQRTVCILIWSCRGAAVVPGRSALQNQGDNLLR